MTERTRLAVLGSPIGHSKSPAIQRAAYGVLGLPWSYESADVTGETLSGYVSSRDGSWRGLSLTMPLKRDVLSLLDSREPLVDIVGGANTVLFTDDGLRGFNTDVAGVERSFQSAGIDHLGTVWILGAGATAASVIAGVARLGASQVIVFARTPSKATALVDLGTAVGVQVEARPWGVDESLAAPSAIVSTVPGGENDLAFAESIRSSSALFDVAYDPWPSTLAIQWADAGGTVISGYDLLVNQAVGQVRVFVHGDPDHHLEREDEVIAAMRAALV